jgi:hypothetical protein
MVELKETIVIDDIIPENLQNEFHDILINYPMWRFIKDMSYADYDMQFPSYGFNMMFKHPDHGIVSPLYEKISVPIANAILEKTNIKFEDIYFNRAFLQLPLEKRFVKENNGVHVDIFQPHYACVYYINDSDGDTIIYEQNKFDTEGGSKNVNLVEHKRVTPKKGRVVIFDGMRYHCSSQPKDSYRCIINFDLI